MPIYICAFLAGILLLQQFSFLPGVYLVGTSLCGVVIVCLVLYRYCFAHIIFKLIIVAAVGFCLAFIHAHLILSWHLPKDLEGKNIIITGYIASLPKVDNRRAAFEFKTITVNNEKQSTKLKLSWYYNYPPINVGDKWQLEVRLKRPGSNFNPGGFDFEKYLFEHKIRATGYVIFGENNQLLHENKSLSSINQMRQSLREQIQEALFSQPLNALIATLIIGDQSGITKDQWQVFRNTGTSYLMAIAGLHVGLVAGVMLLIVQFLWRRVPALVLLAPAQQAGAIAGLIIGIVYSVISGFSVPTQRALIMLIAFLLSLVLRIAHRSWNAFFLSLFVVLLIDPLAVLEIGFWLSFTAVAFIIYFSSNRLRLNASAWKRCLRMQWAITLGLLPLTLLLFQQFSLVSFAANIIALPLVCFIVVPMSLAGGLLLPVYFYLGRWILLLAEKLMELVWYYLQFLAHLPNIYWNHPIFTWWIFAASVIGIILLLAPGGTQGRMAGVFCLLPLIFYKPLIANAGSVRFSLLDVNYGMAALAKTRDHALLYYLSPNSAISNQMETIVVPFLRSQGVGHIDVLITNHSDTQDIHKLIKEIPVQSVFIGETPADGSLPANNSGGIAVRSCYYGQGWEWNDVNFTFLNPTINSNALSSGYGGWQAQACVLKITTGNKSILLPGNIKIFAEKLLAKDVADRLAATIMVAPYRGHDFAAAPEFVGLVQAKYILFSVNRRTVKNFLAQKIASEYSSGDAKIYYTAHDGAVTFELKRNKALQQGEVFRELYREAARHYWNDWEA